MFKTAHRCCCSHPERFTFLMVKEMEKFVKKGEPPPDKRQVAV
jgi:hypothetical protein